MTKESIKEEFYAYVPREKTWYEIGFNETVCAGEIEYLNELIKNKKNNEIHVYHTHLRKAKEKFEKEGNENIPLTWLAFTTVDDIVQMIHYSKKFYKYHPNGKMVFKIASPFGITSYKLTEKGKKYFRNGIFLNYPKQLLPLKDKLPENSFTVTGSNIKNMINWVDSLSDLFKMKYFPRKE